MLSNLEGEGERGADEAELARRRRQIKTYLNLARVHQAIERRAGELFAEQELEGITPAQSNVLIVLIEARGPLAARRIAERLSLSEVTVGRFIQALEHNGWVARRKNPDDARARLVEPTRRTFDALPRLIAIANGLLDQAFAGLSEQQIDTLGAAVESVRRNLAG